MLYNSSGASIWRIATPHAVLRAVPAGWTLANRTQPSNALRRYFPSLVLSQIPPNWGPCPWEGHISPWRSTIHFLYFKYEKSLFGIVSDLPVPTLTMSGIGIHGTASRTWTQNWMHRLHRFWKQNFSICQINLSNSDMKNIFDNFSKILLSV